MIYIYHALINALSAHMIHINLNMIFYTHVEHSPTKAIYIKYYKKTKNKTKNTHLNMIFYTHVEQNNLHKVLNKNKKQQQTNTRTKDEN